MIAVVNSRKRRRLVNAIYWYFDHFPV